MNYFPLSNRIVGKTVKKGERVLASGLVVPEDIDKSPYMYVEVVAVGRGYVSQTGNIVPMETKIGDIVILINSSPFILPRDNDIYGTVENLETNKDLVIFQESDIFCKVA
jgi:co-chaperonin GroES (HSP10)